MANSIILYFVRGSNNSTTSIKQHVHTMVQSYVVTL